MEPTYSSRDGKVCLMLPRIALPSVCGAAVRWYLNTLIIGASLVGAVMLVARGSIDECE